MVYCEQICKLHENFNIIICLYIMMLYFLTVKVNYSPSCIVWQHEEERKKKSTTAATAIVLSSI